VVRRGDVDTALAESTHVVTETFRTQFVEHAFLEPESALAVPGDGGRMRVYSQGQGAWEDRRQIASFLGVPPEDVRVTQVTRKVSGPAFRDNRATLLHALRKSGGQWKFYNTVVLKIEYLD
jgi:xanthine dehydrogenase molybdenum-binding subunit